MINSNTSSSLGVNSQHQTDRASAPTQLSRIGLNVEVISLEIPNSDILSQAFEKVRTLENYLKPIVMEGIAKKLGVSKKTLEKSYEAWMMERIERISQLADVQANQNGEEG